MVEAPYFPDIDFYYRIFNADGREVEQGGNGAELIILQQLLNLKD